MEFKQILDKYGLIVDEELNNFLNKKIDSAKDEFLKNSYSYLKEFVLRSGKRIRPILTIMAYKAFKGSDEEGIYPLSIAPELYHAPSLLHDDIMDEDLLRREKDSMHVVLEKHFKKNLLTKAIMDIYLEANQKDFLFLLESYRAIYCIH